jgi:predicted nucleic acid-binding Zn finger protein
LTQEASDASNNLRAEKANKVVQSLGVKRHVFEPSGFSVWTVVGKEGDFLVDIEAISSKQYCSCRDFHFRVLSGKVPECYHLIAARTALKERKYATTKFSDEELNSFLKALLKDSFSHLE